MNAKHAYLILAHNELPVLCRLLKAIDDPRNEVFVHWDAKVADVPELHMQHAALHIVRNRVDVRWGDYSVVKAEFELFRAATSAGEFAYYHLLSGVDMPLRSQDEIHAFFEANQGREFIGFSQYNGLEAEIARKMRWHLFPSAFQRSPRLTFRSLLRSALLKVQILTGLTRAKGRIIKKGTQWISVTDSFVRYMISREAEMDRLFSHTFCADEMFAQTLCWDSSFRNSIFDAEDEGRGCMRAIGWKDGVLYPWTDADHDALMSSGAMFARKFTSEDIALVDRILNDVCR